MAHPDIALESEQIVLYKAVIGAADALQLPTVASPAGPHDYVYFVAFDGTGNDRDAIEEGYQRTNPDLLAEMVATAKATNPRLSAEYYAGVVNLATGDGARTIVDGAWGDYIDKANAWIASDPLAVIKVVVTGFSRGSAEAREFLNRVDEYGVPANKGYSQSGESAAGVAQTRIVYDSFTRAGGTVRSAALLYDTVATGQDVTNPNDLDGRPYLKLTIPTSTDLVVQLTALNENRSLLFPVTSILPSPGYSLDKRLIEFGVPGAHSDIGGSYVNGVDGINLRIGADILAKMGLPISLTGVPNYPESWVIHDSRFELSHWFPAIDGLLTADSRPTHYSANPTLSSTRQTDVSALFGTLNSTFGGAGAYSADTTSMLDLITGRPATENWLTDAYGGGTLTGGSAKDLLIGKSQSHLSGGLGDDVLVSDGGAKLDGGGGDDTYFAYGGEEVTDSDLSGEIELYADGLQTASFTRSGHDLVIHQATGNPDNVLDDITVRDWLRTDGSGTRAFDVNLIDPNEVTNATFSYDAITAGILTVHGDADGVAQADTLAGIGGYANTLFGESGNDSLSGEDFAWYTGPGNSYTGGLDDDTIFGTHGVDTYNFSAGDGHDTVRTGGGADILHVATGATTFERDGIDLLVHVNKAPDGSGDETRVKDWFTAGTTENMLGSVEANATTYSGSFVTTQALHIEGSDDATTRDFIYGVSGYSDVVNANAGRDFIDLEQSGSILASDTVHGGEGNDIMGSGDSNDFLYGDAGDDYLENMGGSDLLDGGSGNDYIVDFGSASTLLGGSGDDTLYSVGDFAILRGGEGSDSLQSEGSGVVLEGGAGDDYFWSSGPAAYLSGGTGNDDINVQGADTVIGIDSASGQDLLSLYDVTNAVVRATGIDPDSMTAAFEGSSLVLSAGATTLTIQNYLDASGIASETNDLSAIEFDHVTWSASDILAHAGYDPLTLKGTAYNDYLYGNGVATRILGLAGDDVLSGWSNTAEVLDGGAGADTLYGYAGDTLIGGSGNDSLQTAESGVVAYGGAGNDTVIDWAGGSTFVWKQGDGTDAVETAQNSSLFRFDGAASYSLAAQRSGANLVVSASTGGGVIFSNWFNGQNRASVEAPDGSVWTPDAIDANFSSATYDVAYSSGVHDDSAFVDVIGSYIPTVAYHFDYPVMTFLGGTQTGEIEGARTLAFYNGVQHTDSSGQIYFSYSVALNSSASAMVSQLPNGAVGTETFAGNGTVNFDIWQVDGGAYSFAVTDASWQKTHSMSWMNDSNHYDPTYDLNTLITQTTGIGSWSSGHSARQVTELTPKIDSFTLFEPNTPSARMFASMQEPSDVFVASSDDRLYGSDFFSTSSSLLPHDSNLELVSAVDSSSSFDTLGLRQSAGTEQRSGQAIASTALLGLQSSSLLERATLAAEASSLTTNSSVGRENTRVFTQDRVANSNDFRLFA